MNTTLTQRARIDARVSCCSVRRLRLPLKRPYKLAFGPVEAFDTVLVTASIDGTVGCGEATVLTGYTEETIEESWALAQTLAAQIDGLEIMDAEAILRTYLAKAPFTVTAFYTAIEMASRHPVLYSTQERAIPLLKILQTMEAPEIAEELDQAFAEGYSTLKIKAGFNADEDLERVQTVQRLAAGRFKLTVDANQGYRLEDGVRFAKSLTPEAILFFEQACDKDDWHAAIAVARASAVAVMLDESIYDLEDIRRAAAFKAADYVKVKLMKFGSLSLLEEGLSEIRKLNLKPVLGNGVATDIGCWMEACVAHGRIATAGEMNGFLKLRYPVVRNPLSVSGGNLVVPAQYRPVLDESAISAQTVDLIAA